MSTRSTIALEFADGTVSQVYCHSDGYLSWNGKKLLMHYNDAFVVRDLIDNGDISVLKETIGEKHPFSNPGRWGTPEFDEFEAKYGHMTRFYGRDRGESGIEARRFKDFDDYAMNHQREEYEYILRTDGVWYVDQGRGAGYEPLLEALVEHLREEDNLEAEHELLNRIANAMKL